MRRPRSIWLSALTCCLVASAGLVLVGQQSAGGDWSVPRTSSGRPDLQGVWSNNGITPLERPAIFGDRAELTDAEVATLRQRTEELFTAKNDAGANVFSDFLFRQIVGDCADWPCEFDTATGKRRPVPERCRGTSRSPSA